MAVTLVRRALAASLGLLLALGLLGSGLSFAAKPSGGGGGTVPPGTIFFEQGEFPFTPRQMSADGGNKTASVRGEPSWYLHDDARWFLAGRNVSSDTHSAYEIVAVSADGGEVPLGVTVEIYLGGRWAKDDSFLSFEAILNGPEGQSSGLFVADVDWNLGTPAIGAPVKVLDLNLVDGYPEIYFGDWSPLGDEFVHVRETLDADGNPDYSLEVVRFFADGTTETRGLVTDSFAYSPQWSPDGSRIAFQGPGDGIWTIAPNGTDLTQLTSPPWGTSHYDPSWSPDGQHLVFTQGVRNQLKKGQLFPTYTYDILRITATGSGKTNLTSDTSEKCFAIAWR